MKRLVVSSAMIAAYLALGAKPGEAAGDPKAMQLTYRPWAKICVNRADGNSDCFISSGAKGACQPSGGGIAVAIRDGKQRSLSVNLVAMRILDGTLSVRVDQRAPIPIPDPACQEQGCRGKLDIDPEFIERLKHSQLISIEAVTRDHQSIRLPFPLAGFSEAYDGPAGMTPKAAEVTSEELKQQRMKRTENPPQCQE